MADESWGNVDGDRNAEGIIADRLRARSSLTATIALFFAALVATAVWYALTGSRAALAIEIILAAICAGGWSKASTFETHTLVMIAETRARLIEGEVQGIKAASASR